MPQNQGGGPWGWTPAGRHAQPPKAPPHPRRKGGTLGWRQTPLLLAPPRPQALPDLAQVAHPHGPQLPHLLSGRNEGPFLCARGGNCCLWAGAFVNADSHLPVGVVWELRSRGCSRFWLTRQPGPVFMSQEPRLIWAAVESPSVGGCRRRFPTTQKSVPPPSRLPAALGPAPVPVLQDRNPRGAITHPRA